MSSPVGWSARLCAAASLSLLLTRLRVTAFPTAFDTMNPTRVGAAGLGTAYKTTFRRPLRAPERTVWEKSADERTRFLAANIQDARTGGQSCGGSIGKPKAVLCRQFGTALATACGKNGTAGTGTHAKAEAVLLGTTAVIRLKSPLAHGGYSKTICAGACCIKGESASGCSFHVTDYAQPGPGP